MIRRPNTRIFMAIAAASLLAGGGTIFWAWSGLNDQNSRVDSLKSEAIDLKSVQAKLGESEKKLNDCKALLTHLERGVPDHAYVPTLLAELEKVGLANGIKVTGVKPVFKAPTPKKEGEKKKAYDEVNIEVKGVGKYADVQRFIAALNNFPKIVAARTLSLTPKTTSNETWSDTLDVVVELRGFVFATKGKDAADDSIQDETTTSVDPKAAAAAASAKPAVAANQEGAKNGR